jgi:hypothetical protein
MGARDAHATACLAGCANRGGERRRAPRRRNRALRGAGAAAPRHDAHDAQRARSGELVWLPAQHRRDDDARRINGAHRRRGAVQLRTGSSRNSCDMY